MTIRSHVFEVRLYLYNFMFLIHEVSQLRCHCGFSSTRRRSSDVTGALRSSNSRETDANERISRASHETRDSRKILREPYYLFRVFGGASVTAVEIAGFRSAIRCGSWREARFYSRACTHICVCVTSLFSNSTETIACSCPPGRDNRTACLSGADAFQAPACIASHSIFRRDRSYSNSGVAIRHVRCNYENTCRRMQRRAGG